MTPCIAHQPDDRVAALDRAIGIAARIVALGTLRERRERRRLGEIQIAHGLAEVALRGRLDAVGAVAEVDLVEVELEDFLLRVTLLDLPRDLRFLELSRERLLAGDLLGEDVARELHRERREALREVPVHDIGCEGAEHARPVDARVLVEALVLGDDERLLHRLRNVGELDERAALEPELGDEASVRCVELARLARLECVELRRIGTRAFAADEAPRGPGDADGECDGEAGRRGASRG